MLRALALCLALSAAPAAAQQRTPPPRTFGLELADFQQRFDATAARLGVQLQAEPVKCETFVRLRCDFEIGSNLTAAFTADNVLVDQVTIHIPEGRPMGDAVPALRVLMEMFEPRALLPDRDVAVRTLFRPLSEAPSTARRVMVGDTRFSNLIVAGQGALVFATRRSL